MESSPSANPKRSIIQTTNWIATTPTTGSSAVESASMFNSAQSSYIAGGTFSITTNTTNANTVNELSLDALYKRVAPHAILNAGGRADDVGCHPGTREEVLGRIVTWRDAQNSLAPPIFWLSGPAGAGKTAIVQTIAERCNAQGVPQSNFFFYRTDTSRNSLSPLVATLVHQIILLYPEIRNLVATVLWTNPLILDSILEDQLRQLIVKPLQTFRQSSSSYLTPLLLIDGLDECESEEKRNQRQIIDAFDKVLVEHPYPFRLLVASRDESQIRAAFNNVSFSLLPLYLDDQYSPEDDIRAYVSDEFKRIRWTHPLAHTLDETWPSVKDVEDIVWKSSGQFIYAATVMRFIFNSSASPTLSLARVHGAAQISANTKSPFSHLDTVYTYILSQVDDQEALKDILHAQSLIQADALPVGFMADDQPKLVDILQAYNPKYTEAMVQSCLADLTSISQYTQYHQLLFHHASFPDYLLDQSRSGGYFVDINAFDFEIQPALWKACYREVDEQRRSQLKDVALKGLLRLRQLPPGFLNTLTIQDLLSAGNKTGPFYLSLVRHLKHIHSLCVCDDDVTNYKRILCQWICTRPVEYLIFQCEPEEQPHDSKWPPCSHRYFAMVYIGDHLTTEPPGWFDTALRCETDFDIKETARWLAELLHHIHTKKYHNNVEEYNLLLQKWIFWASRNDIPLDRADNLPKARQYRAMAHIERDVTTEPYGWIDIALRPENDVDAREMALWLKRLLHRIHREIYHNSAQEYTVLLQKWMTWATWNDIPLDGVDELPNALWYLRLSRVKRGVASYLGFGSRT